MAKRSDPRKHSQLFDGLNGKPVTAVAWQPRSFVEPLHYHLEYELGVALRGTGHFIVADRIYDVEPGDIFVQAPYRGHIAWNGPRNPALYYFFYIHPRFLLANDETDRIVTRIFDSRLQPRIQASAPEAQAIGTALKRAFDLSRSKRATAPLDFRCALLQACARIYDYYEGRRMFEAGPAASPHSYERLLPALAFVHQNIETDISCAHLAQLAGLSTSRFAHLFRQTMRLSVGAYVARTRMEVARHALLHSGRSIKEIAYEVGCSSPEVFSRQFSKAYGESPREYRKQAQ